MKPSAPDVIFFVTHDQFPSRSGVIGDYLSTRRFASLYPEIGVGVVKFGVPESKVRISDDGIGLFQPGIGWTDIGAARAFVYHPVSFEPEDIALEPPGGEAGAPSFAHRQWRVISEFLENALPTIGPCINHPARARLACNKLHQRKFAAAAGLRFVPGLVTNDPRAVVKRGDGADQGIMKYISEGGDWNGEGETSAQLVAPRGLAETGMATGPRMFQELITSDHELRFYIFDEDVIAVRAEVPDKLRFPDMRTQAREPGRFSLTRDYAAFHGRLVAYTKALGLRYAVVDAIPNRSDLYLLEINVNGTWDWLSADVAATLADAYHRFVRSALD